MKPVLEPRSHYRRLGLIGQGQFGRVYFGVNRQTGKFAALKDLSPQQFPTHKFLRELTYLVTLHHPNIVTFIALEHHRRGRYLITSYCEAGTLRDLMETAGTLNRVQSLKLVADILQGLDHAHRRHIIHCDLKPENILLSLTPEGWTAKISDFGISQLGKETGMPLIGKGYTGSPAYMAPERFYGQYSIFSDLYAVGVLLYELIVGDRPFSGLPKDLIAAHLNQKPDIPDSIPPVLRTILERSLQKLPQHRFASAQEMLKSVKLATQIEIAQGNAQLWSAPPPALASPAVAVKWQQEFAREIEQLAIADGCIFWRSGQQVGHLPLVGDRSESQPFWEIGLPDPIVYFQAHVKGCSIATQSPTHWYLYRWQPSQPFPSEPYIINEGQRHSFATNRGGEWGAIARRDRQGKIAYRTINFLRPQMRPIGVELPFPDFLIPLDRRHALVIAEATSDPKPQTAFHLIDRRAQKLGEFNLPLRLRSPVLGQFNEPILCGIEDGETPLGIVMGLRPLKVTRFPLALDPSFIEAFPWGFCLLDRQGQGILIDRYGDRLGQFDLAQTTTAIAAIGQDQLLVASQQQERYFLSWVDLAPLLEALS